MNPRHGLFREMVETTIAAACENIPTTIDCRDHHGESVFFVFIDDEHDGQLIATDDTIICCDRSGIVHAQYDVAWHHIAEMQFQLRETYAQLYVDLVDPKRYTELPDE